LSQKAIVMTASNRSQFDLPAAGVAVVIGRETDGVSSEMLAAADKRMYFPTVR
jgi:tRNA C32,U32 (ribose-2'-O)-methylase TrmJ